MFDKLLQAQQKAEEIKKRLDLISVSAEVEGGKIRITSTANKHISSVSIDPEFLQISGS
jgi:DNA-binding protein YbaB